MKQQCFDKTFFWRIKITLKALPLIIGISESGKSTLARALTQRLEATLISWDEYDEISTTPPDYVEWHEYGRPEGLAAWKYPQFVEDLSELKKGNSLVSRIDGRVVNPTAWIVFDTPLGRDHRETGQYIDVHIHIDTSLDVALCR